MMVGYERFLVVNNSWWLVMVNDAVPLLYIGWGSMGCVLRGPGTLESPTQQKGRGPLHDEVHGDAAAVHCQSLPCATCAVVDISTYIYLLRWSYNIKIEHL